jgi:hypothetical protein
MLDQVTRLLAGTEVSLIRAAHKAGSLRRRVYAFQARRHAWPVDEKIEFFRQRLQVENIPDRMPMFEELCGGKDVLHVGCVDWPIFHPATNLHLKLAPIAKSLTGLDPDQAGLDVLRRHHAGDYFARPEDINRSFDVLLVPEVIEHVPNVGQFLAELDKLDFTDVMITGPNAIYRESCPWWSATYSEGDTLVEFVHPDHKCYFSPYTLRHVIETLTPWTVTRVGTTTQETAVFVQAKKASAAANRGERN